MLCTKSESMKTIGWTHFKHSDFESRSMCWRLRKRNAPHAMEKAESSIFQPTKME